MNIKLEYNARHKRTQYPLFSGEVHLHITKKEARFIARRYFIWERTIERLDFPYDYDAIEMVLEKGSEKACKFLFEEQGLRRDEYALEIEISDDQEELFTNKVIKDYFKHLLTEAIREKVIMFRNQPFTFSGGCTIHNDPTLTALYEDSISYFQQYYVGNLTHDAQAIQRRIIRQHEQGLI